MKIDKKLRKTLLSLCVIGTTMSISAADIPGMNTTKMVNSTLPGLSECVHYCVVGMQVRMEYIPPFKIRVFRTPIVRHNISDFVVMSHETSEDSAWLDYRKFFGVPFKLLGDQILMAASGGIAKEIGGGKSEYKAFGQHQSLVFKDADVMGNPNAYFIESLGGKINGKPRPYYTKQNGLFTEKHYYDEEVRYYTDSQLKSDLDKLAENMANNINFALTDSIYQAFGGPMYRLLVKAHPETLKFTMKAKMLAKSFGGRISWYACDSGGEPFKPYFSSRLDGLLWREGFPINDSHKASTILNPLSNDDIKPKRNEGGLSLPGLKASWGQLYPRSGFLNSVDDYKTGAVIAYRGMDVASQGGGGHIAQKTGRATEEVFWQAVYPNPSKTCYKSIADTVTDNNVDGNYAWSGWRRYQCSLNTDGWVIATIMFGEAACIGNGAK